MMLPFAEWLSQQRWYAGRNRTVESTVPALVTPLGEDLDHVIIAVSYRDGGLEHYQVFVGWDHGADDELAPVGTIGPDDGRVGYDALFSEVWSRRLLSLIQSSARLGELEFVPEPGTDLPLDAVPRMVDAEQSNTSVVFDRSAILKVFRRIVAGVNPDIELNRVLGRAGCPHTAKL